MAIVRYKYQIVNHRRNNYLHQQVDIAGVIWNYAIAIQRRYYKLTGKYISPNILTSHLRKLRRERFTYWKILPARTLPAIVKRIDTAYRRFFKGISKLPRFRKVKKFRSFVVQGNNWEILEHRKNKYLKVRIFKDEYEVHYSRDLPALATQAVTVKRTPDGKFWLSFTVKVDTPQVKSTSGKIAGLDFGLLNYLTVSDGQTYTSPEFFKSDIGKIRRQSKRLSRKKKNSNGRKRALLKLGRAYASISNHRDDYQWKLAHRLFDTYDVLCFEDLNIDGMRRLWGRKISDLSHYSFLKKLEWIAEKRGKSVVYVDRFYPSSKTCSKCGVIKDSLGLRDRTFECESCGYKVGRDYNASKNIKKEGELLLQEASKTAQAA